MTDEDYFLPPWDTAGDAEDGDESVPEVIDEKALVEFFSSELGKSAMEMKKLKEETICLKGQLALSELEQKLMVGRLVQENREISTELAGAKAALANSQAQASSLETELMQTQAQVAQLATQLAQSAVVKQKRTPTNRPMLVPGALEGLRQVVGRLKNRNEAVSVAVQATPAGEPVDSASGALAKQMTNRVLDPDALSSFRSDLSATLTASQEGYASVKAILKDLIEDSGKDGEEVARSFGYASFAQLLLSDAMSPVVSVLFKAKATPENAHILQAQEESNAHWAERFRKTKALLDRKSAKVRQLDQRNRALRHEAHQMSARLQEMIARLEHFELSFQCIICRECNIEIVYGCGHGACAQCSEKWTRRDPAANRFRPNPDAPMASAGPPMCPAACGSRISTQLRFYGNT